MGRHEEYLAACMAQYKQDASKTVLEAWHRFPPDRATCRCVENIDVHFDMSVEDVIAIARQLDGCLLSFYRKLAESTGSEEIRNLFQSLLEMEQREDRQYAISAGDI